MIVKLLTEHNLEFLSLKGDCRGSSESILVRMSHCWKSHVMAQLLYEYFLSIVDMQRRTCHNMSEISLCHLQCHILP